MEVTIGKAGLTKTFQDDFPKIIRCPECGYDARHAFTAHEDTGPDLVCDLHDNDFKGPKGFWPHDACCVAVYFCNTCTKAISLWNQG
jgi:hypothetical protein